MGFINQRSHHWWAPHCKHYGNPIPEIRGYAKKKPCGIAAAQGDANAVQTCWLSWDQLRGSFSGTCLKPMEKQKWDQIVDQPLGLAQNMSISETLMWFFEF